MSINSYGDVVSSRTRKDSGQSLVLVALFMLALFAFAALSIDVGKMYVVKKRLQNATDSGSHAGAMELPLMNSSDTGYDTRAREFAMANNNVTSSEIQSVQVGTYDPLTKTFAPSTDPLLATAVRVQATRTVNLSFAPVIGIKSLPVTAHSIAQAFETDSVTGLAMPWAIEFNPTNPPVLCQEVVLKMDAEATGGIWAPVNNPDFDDSNSGRTYRDRIMGGYEGTLTVGDKVHLVPGEKTGNTAKGVKARIDMDPDATCETVENDSGRLVVVPFIPPGSVAIYEAAPNTEITVSGFAVFFLTGVSEDQKTGAKTVFGKYQSIFAGNSVGHKTPTPVGPKTVLLVE